MISSGFPFSFFFFWSFATHHCRQNFSQQSKDAQHTAPVRLWPVFVVPRRFAILTTRPFSFPPKKLFHFLFQLLVLTYSFCYMLRLLFFFFQKKEGCALSLILWRDGREERRWVLSRAPVPTGQWQLVCQWNLSSLRYSGSRYGDCLEPKRKDHPALKVETVDGEG